MKTAAAVLAMALMAQITIASTITFTAQVNDVSRGSAWNVGDQLEIKMSYNQQTGHVAHTTITDQTGRAVKYPMDATRLEFDANPCDDNQTVYWKTVSAYYVLINVQGATPECVVPPMDEMYNYFIIDFNTFGVLTSPPRVNR